MIENRPGGGTNIAMQSVVNSPPDGYTLGMTFATNTINPSLYKSLPFDFQRDIAPVSGLADLPLVLVVNKDVPAKDVTGFVAYAKANPGKITFASFGARTISHLAIELLKTSTGIEFVHVPYPGGPQMITDMISGRIQAGDGCAAELAAAYPERRGARARGHVAAAQPRASRTCRPSAKPFRASRSTPGRASACLRRRPPEIVERLNRDINASLADPALKSRYADVGAVPMIFTPAEARAKIASDIAEMAQGHRKRRPQAGVTGAARRRPAHWP